MDLPERPPCGFSSRHEATDPWMKMDVQSTVLHTLLQGAPQIDTASMSPATVYRVSKRYGYPPTGQIIRHCSCPHLVEDTDSVEGALRLDRRAVLCVECGLRLLELCKVRSGEPLLRAYGKRWANSQRYGATVRITSLPCGCKTGRTTVNMTTLQPSICSPTHRSESISTTAHFRLVQKPEIPAFRGGTSTDSPGAATASINKQRRTRLMYNMPIYRLRLAMGVSNSTNSTCRDERSVHPCLQGKPSDPLDKRATNHDQILLSGFSAGAVVPRLHFAIHEPNRTSGHQTHYRIPM